jgi:hypothetical protein
MSSQSPKILLTFSKKPGTVAGSKCDYFYWELHEGWSQQAVRKGDWKGVRLNMARKPNGPIELYYLKTDIGKKRYTAA